MRKLITPITACALIAACAPFASAATTFLATNSNDLTDVTNWSNGLPTGGNAGTVSIDGTFPTGSGNEIVGYDITHTAGTVTRVGINSVVFDDSTYILNGGNWSTRGVNATNNSVYTVDSGTFTTESGRDSSAVSGGSFVFNGGVSTHGRNLYLDGGDIEVNGGQVNISADLGSRNFHSGGILSLNGGQITATYLTFGTGGLEVNFGGTVAGSLVIENFGGGRADTSNIDINFSVGSLMEMTLTNPVESGASGDGDLGWSQIGLETGNEWAEDLWATGRLTYGGQGEDVLGDWATVEGTLFAYDDLTNTLSLVPEPSSLALLGLGGLCVLRRRRG